MDLIPLVIFCAFGLFIWWRQVQDKRRRWLRRLGLPGRWQLLPAMSDQEKPSASSAAAEPVASLELSGELTQGNYRWLDAADGHLVASGRWQLSGHRLQLQAGNVKDAPRHFDLRLLNPTEVGLFEPATACYWVLNRSANSNVINLPRREQKR